jgi:dual specificity tyrosine-phosphorylation-regulated kinase 2/3/4
MEAPVIGGSQVATLPPLPNSARGNGTAPPSPPLPSPQAHAGNGPAAGDVTTPRPVTSAAANAVLYSPLSGRESAERRAAGTARWVFDRQNSAGSDVFKSLVNFLDQSPRTQPLQMCSTDVSEAGGGGTTRGPSPRDANACGVIPTAKLPLASTAEVTLPEGEESCCGDSADGERSAERDDSTEEEERVKRYQSEETGEDREQGGLGPWGEPSVAQLLLLDDDEEEEVDVALAGPQQQGSAQSDVSNARADAKCSGNGRGKPSPRAHPLQDATLDEPHASESAEQEDVTEAVDEILGTHANEESPKNDGNRQQQGLLAEQKARDDKAMETHHRCEMTPPVGSAASRPPPPSQERFQSTVVESNACGPSRSPEGLRAVRTAATKQPGSIPHLLVFPPEPQDVETNDQAGEENVEDHPCSPPVLQTETPRDASDPFSFPVTSPSEHGERTLAPLPVFGSWPSFKNMSSPCRGNEYCSTEEESTPASSARRGRRQRLSTASTGNLAGLPPLAPVANSYRQGGPTSGRLGSGCCVARGGSGLGQYDDIALYDYDEDALQSKYEELTLRVLHRRGMTGFEPTRELPLRVNDLIAGRYQIMDLLGQAAFSRAVQAKDLKTGALVCLKVVKNNKDYFDQSLDEIKMLRVVNDADPGDEQGVLRLLDYFYFKEHLILVTELLRANLYEFSKHCRAGADPHYFSPARVQMLASQVLRSLAFLHSLGVIHADLKPENILMKSYSRCEVKIIDLGSSCFVSDRLSSYVQSRSYRAPEVILGLPYGQKIDIWSLGCIIAELASGKVLFHNTCLPGILARIEGIIGPAPQHMIRLGRYSHRYYMPDGRIYERNPRTGQAEVLRPKKTCIARRISASDPGMVDFLSYLLQVDPAKRPTAAEALHHPWLHQRY